MTKPTILLQYTCGKSRVYSMMKHLIILCVAVCILFVSAASAQVNVSAQLENDKFHSAGKTNVLVKIKNENDFAISDVRLKADSISVSLAQEMVAGESLIYESEITISDDALTKGFLTVSVLYSADGVEYLSQAMCDLTKLEDKVEAKLFCVTPDRALLPDESVPVRMVFVNVGYTDIKNGRLFINENLSGTDGFSIAAKSSLSYEIDVPVKELGDLQARVECESAISGKKYTFQFEKPVYDLVREELVLSVAGKNEVSYGDPPKLSLNIENRGNVSYRQLELTSNLNAVSSQLPEVLKPGDFITVPLTVTAKINDSAYLVLGMNGVRDDGVSVKAEAEPYVLTVLPESEFNAITNEQPKNEAETIAASGDILGRLFYALIYTPHLAEYVFAGAAILSIAAITALIRRAGKKKEKLEAGRKTNV